MLSQKLRSSPDGQSVSYQLFLRATRVTLNQFFDCGFRQCEDHSAFISH